MVVIDGKKIAADIKESVRRDIEEFKEKTGRKVCLAVVLVGNDPASKVYVGNKIKAAEYVGIKSLSFDLPEDSVQEDVEKLVSSLSSDDGVDGILVQLPLPKHLDSEKILSLIDPVKDVDGFSAENIGNLTLFKETVAPCTPSGIIALLKSTGVTLSGKNAVVIGRSNIVGKPIALLLLKEDCTVTVCHSKTKDLKAVTSRADIVIAAVGKPCFITADMVKEGAIVIDVGISRKDNRLLGDVDFVNVAPKTSFITPVPGGVGPMTIAMLMKNALICAKRRTDVGI